jgi:hypothetical protein
VVCRFPFDAQQLAALERQPDEATMRQSPGVLSGIGILARRAGGLPKAVVFPAIAILAGAGSYFLSAERHRVTTVTPSTVSPSPVRQERPPLKQLPAKSSLAFTVESRGPALLLTWNGQSPPIANASLGMITIWSGGTIRNLTLTAEQLRSGSIVYKPVSDQVEFQLAVMSGDQVTQESVIALLPERSDPQPASRSSKRTRPTSISSRERSRSSESTDSVERPGLRTFSPPAPLVRTSSSLPASLDQPPVALESNTNKIEVFSLLGPPLAPPPTGETLPASNSREMTIQTYTGMVVDAVCARRATDNSCGVSPTTALFALRLQDGRILPFDSIGNDRVRNRKKKWVATASSGRPIQAKVSGTVLGDKLIVVSIN